MWVWGIQIRERGSEMKTQGGEAMRVLQGHPELRHWCGKEHCEGNVPAKEDPFCGSKGEVLSPDSDKPISCRRLAGHSGPHSAFQMSISVPTEWAS